MRHTHSVHHTHTHTQTLTHVRRERKKQEKEDARRRVIEEQEAKAAAEAAAKKAVEEQEKKRAEEAKKVREVEKKAIKKERQRVRQLCDGGWAGGPRGECCPLVLSVRVGWCVRGVGGVQGGLQGGSSRPCLGGPAWGMIQGSMRIPPAVGVTPAPRPVCSTQADCT